MNKYIVITEMRKNLYGPFKNANAAAKWANKNLRGPANTPTAWTIARLFKP